MFFFTGMGGKRLEADELEARRKCDGVNDTIQNLGPSPGGDVPSDATFCFVMAASLVGRSPTRKPGADRVSRVCTEARYTALKGLSSVHYRHTSYIFFFFCYFRCVTYKDGERHETMARDAKGYNG